MSYLLLRSTVATLIAFIGGGIGVWLGNVAAPKLRLLVYAARGVLPAVTVFDVLPDAKDLSDLAGVHDRVRERLPAVLSNRRV